MSTLNQAVNDSGMSTIRRIAAATGIVAPVLAYVAILTATVLFDGFSWYTNALSHTGAVADNEYASAAAQSSVVFNNGLRIAGLLALPYVVLLFRTAEHRIQQVGAVCFGAAGIALSMVGFFPVGRGMGLHTLSALVHYLGFTFGLWFYGTGSVFLDREAWGVTTMWMGILHLLLWIVWAVQAALGGPITGLAVPEFLGGLFFVVWIGGTALRYLGVGPLFFE